MIGLGGFAGTLQQTHRNSTRTAKILGLTRQGLLKKIARFEIPL
jgi:DNA-binding protein Fis